jgi:hypothetical protein
MAYQNMARLLFEAEAETLKSEYVRRFSSMFCPRGSSASAITASLPTAIDKQNSPASAKLLPPIPQQKDDSVILERHLSGEVATGEAAGRDFAKRRRLCTAAGDGVAAAWMEVAA